MELFVLDLSFFGWALVAAVLSTFTLGLASYAFNTYPEATNAETASGEAVAASEGESAGTESTAAEGSVENEGGETTQEPEANPYWDESDIESVGNRFQKQALRDNADRLNAAMKEYDAAKDGTARDKALSKIEKIIAADNKRRNALGLRLRDDEGNLVEKEIETEEPATETAEENPQEESPAQEQKSAAEPPKYDTSHLSDEEKFEFETEQSHHEAALKAIKDKYVAGKIKRDAYREKIAAENKAFEDLKKEYRIKEPADGSGTTSIEEQGNQEEVDETTQGQEGEGEEHPPEGGDGGDNGADGGGDNDDDIPPVGGDGGGDDTGGGDDDDDSPPDGGDNGTDGGGDNNTPPDNGGGGNGDNDIISPDKGTEGKPDHL